jgi:hypothetical protein
VIIKKVVKKLLVRMNQMYVKIQKGLKVPNDLIIIHYLSNLEFINDQDVQYDYKRDDR